MRFDTRLQDRSSPEAMMLFARDAEARGMATMWHAEAAGNDPYLPLAVAASVTTTIGLGTAIAVAYGRTPYATAQIAWNLQRLSQGRFTLGLGTQVQAHIERRYGTAWPGGAKALREYVACCRAIWDHWQHGARPAFDGEHFRFTFSNPEFEPGPLPAEHAHIPVWVACVGLAAARIAGTYCDGIHVHAFHTPEYLRHAFRPALAQGAAAAGRIMPLDSSCCVFGGIAHDEAEARQVRDAYRNHIAFYASTAGYLDVLRHHGWEELHEPLRQLARERRWAEMPALIPDDVVDRFVVIGEPGAVGRELGRRYDGLLTQISLYRDGFRFARDNDIETLMEAVGHFA